MSKQFRPIVQLLARNLRQPIVGSVSVAIAIGLAFGAVPMLGQEPAPQTPTQTTAPTPNPDSQIVGAPPEKPKSPAEFRDQAWTILTGAATDGHSETKIQALAALGLMGHNMRSTRLIKDLMKDKDVDVRVAAALAAGETKSPAITSALRDLLDDKEPAVSYIAALTLWKMHDRSGEDVLTAVVDGDRKTSAGMIHGTKHTINKQLHDPAALAKYGATQGAYYFLGPFGIGLTAWDYLHKNGGDTARVSAIEAVSQNHTAPIRAELIDATDDKDLGVRAAACKALARYHDKDVAPALAKVFDDSKPPVRLTAAAAYLISTGAVAGSPAEGETITRSRTH